MYRVPHCSDCERCKGIRSAVDYTSITAVRIKILMHMVKQWEALEWIIHQRQALSGVLRGKGRQD